MGDRNRLPSGTYIIRNRGNLAGRNLREDRSLRPKGVFCPTDSYEGNEQLWQLEQVEGNRYKLSTRGAPVGEHDGKLFAFLTEHEQERVEEWVIKKAEVQDGYIISKQNSPLGWVAPSDEDDSNKQISVRPLIIFPSFPPRYPPLEVWQITTAEGEDEDEDE